MKRVEAYFILNELWKDANEKQREAISIAQNDIEFVDLEIGNCEGCIWANRKRPQRCSCCRRNSDMKDCYEENET